MQHLPTSSGSGTESMELAVLDNPPATLIGPACGFSKECFSESPDAVPCEARRAMELVAKLRQSGV